jgi:hypothetical protein
VPYDMIFMNVCVAVVVMVMLPKGFKPFEIMLKIRVYYFRFSGHSFRVIYLFSYKLRAYCILSFQNYSSNVMKFTAAGLHSRVW